MSLFRTVRISFPGYKFPQIFPFDCIRSRETYTLDENLTLPFNSIMEVFSILLNVNYLVGYCSYNGIIELIIILKSRFQLMAKVTRQLGISVSALLITLDSFLTISLPDD